MSFAQRVLHWALAFFAVIGMLGTPASTVIVPPPVSPERSAFLAEFNAIPPACSQPVDTAWMQKVDSLRWVAYSSPNPDPGTGYYRPDSDAITRDLLALKKAGFNGLITYASSGIMGKQFISIAASLGYQGIIMGVWSPTGVDEMNNAANAAALPIVLGYTIGNEGLGDGHPRYSVLELCSAISDLRSRTGKPVTTSEDIEFYYRWPALLTVGDWLLPIAHPYWHFTKYAEDAVQWEQDQYSAMAARTDRFVFFKEVGLPSAGAPGLTEANQDAYYRGLAQTDVRFAYFEGFDQPSKTSASVEPHWGIFNSDLTPKLIGWNLMGYRIFTGGPGSTSFIEDCRSGNTTACRAAPAGTLLFVGDARDGSTYRALLSFNTAALPDHAIVTAVKLKLKSAGIVGTNPLNARRSLLIEICAPSPNRADPHPAVTANQPRSCSPAGTFGDSPNSGWYSADLSPSAFSSVSLQGATTFHLLLSGPAAQGSRRAYIQFFSTDASESENPVLLVKYRLP